VRGTDRSWALGLFLAALLLRLVHLATIRDSPFFSVLYIDPRWYDEWAQRIAAGDLIGERPFFLDPLYAYVLAAIYAVFGHHYEAVVAFQSVLGALVPPLVLLAARPWFDAVTARLAGVIAVIYLPAIFFGGILMKPALSSFLVALALGLLSRALAGGGPAPWLGAGVVTGLACLARGNLILLLPFAGVWLLVRAGWAKAALYTSGVVLVLALPAMHNFAVSGELILSTSNAGANFYIGNNPTNPSGEYQELPFVNPNPKWEQRDFAREAERRAGRPLGDREISALWFREAGRFIREQPAAWLAVMARKVRAFWGAYEIPDSLDYYLYRETAPVLRLPIPGFGLLAPLGLLGAVLAWRRPGWPRLVVALVVLYALSIIAFFVFSRFRMVIVPALYVLGAHAAVDLVRRWRAARAPEAGRPVLVAAVWPSLLFLALFAFVNVPVRAHVDGWAFHIATSLRLPVRPETSVQGLFNLGAAYAGRAKDEGESPQLLAFAEEQFRRALAQQVEPKHARVQVELGKVLARQHRDREAIAYYEQAAAIEPTNFRIYHALGLLHQRVSEPRQAVAAFSRALDIEPRHGPSAAGLGEALLELGLRQDAERAFRHALEWSPGSETALSGLRRLGVEP
jgi:4-amino-4-deoxy-L-arabinose transferase-like glycosyltransferase